MGSFIDSFNVCGFFQCGKFEFVDISTKRLYTKHMDARETRGGPRWGAKGTGIVNSA